MAEEFDSHDKTEEPTHHRIDDFRKKGQVAVSRELSSVFILASSIGTLGLSILFIYEQLGELVEWIYGLDVEKAYSKEYLKIIINKVLGTFLICAAPFFLVNFLIGIISQVMQFGFIFAPSVLEVKFDKINPINGFKRIFSIRSLVEAVKGFLKFFIIISLAYFVLSYEIWSFGGFLNVGIIDGFLYGKYLIIKLGFVIIGGLFIISMLDFSWERFQYYKKLRLSKQELKEETKEKEGNPEIKQRIRNIQRKISQRRMMQEIPAADVIVSNPTHVSIAIKYDQTTMIAPAVVAKGVDQVALKIREIAKQHEVPIVENVSLARTLYKIVRIGDGIPDSLYKAVAEVLAFVYRLKKKKLLVDRQEVGY